MNINKENLQKQIEEMKTKLADMEAELNKPEVIINYWQPRTAENLYYMNYLGHVAEANYTENYQGDKTRYRVFKTKEEAKRYAEYVKAEETLRRVIAEGNEGWLPNWAKNDEYKYVIILYRCDLDRLSIDSFSVSKLISNFMYIKSKELAEKLMKEYKAEFKTYLSY